MDLVHGNQTTYGRAARVNVGIILCVCDVPRTAVAHFDSEIEILYTLDTGLSDFESQLVLIVRDIFIQEVIIVRVDH